MCKIVKRILTIMFNHNTVHRYWVPVLYFLIWTASLCIGVGNLGPEHRGEINACVIIAWTAFSIFILDTLVNFVDMNSAYHDMQFGSNIFLFSALFLLFIFLSVISSWIFKRTENYIWLPIMLCFMAFSKGCISLCSNNIDIFLFRERAGILDSDY